MAVVEMARSRQGRPLASELGAPVTVAQSLDPVAWLEALEASLDDISPASHLERDGIPVSAATFVAPESWVTRLAGLAESDMRGVVARWADRLGENLKPEECPADMVKDLQALVALCQRAKREGFAVLYVVSS
jgi:hypothetical protein